MECGLTPKFTGAIASGGGADTGHENAEGSASVGMRVRRAARHWCDGQGLFFSFPLGKTDVVGGEGRVETELDSLGALLSFFGFFTILLLSCWPLGMACSFGR